MRNEKGSTNLTEMFIAIAITAGLTAYITPQALETLDAVQVEVDKINEQQISNLNTHAEIMGTITFTAEELEQLLQTQRCE
jgi:ABC-type enterobactin transport system permease subunit